MHIRKSGYRYLASRSPGGSTDNQTVHLPQGIRGEDGILWIERAAGVHLLQHVLGKSLAAGSHFSKMLSGEVQRTTDTA